jgi:KUP system potassium uptake protein
VFHITAIDYTLATIRRESGMSNEASGKWSFSFGPTALTGVAGLGVVFSDIGTSPLYTLKTVLDYTGPNPARPRLSARCRWSGGPSSSTVKYGNVAMRVDNDGEGGIIALMTLLGVKKHKRPIIIAVGLFGAALIYGDGANTPAISVLSALEGLEQIAPTLEACVLPAATIILLVLFAAQPLGTAVIGRAFGPSC